jgi:hypothetical protein
MVTLEPKFSVRGQFLLDFSVHSNKKNRPIFGIYSWEASKLIEACYVMKKHRFNEKYSHRGGFLLIDM